MCPKPVHISFTKKALLSLFLFVGLVFGLGGGGRGLLLFWGFLFVFVAGPIYLICY